MLSIVIMILTNWGSQLSEMPTFSQEFTNHVFVIVFLLVRS